jgi:uncharacterized BrkB/YihY/UPF0761 family membrane protein
MFPGPRQRDFLRTRIRGVATVILILGSMLVAVMAIVVLPSVAAWLARRCHELADVRPVLIEQLCALDFGGIGALAGVAASVTVAFLAALVAYSVIPPDGASLRQASLPAIAVGVAVGLFTSLFAWIAPLLVRQWSTLGLVGDVFIALVWFKLVFQALMYGAAFARLRRDRGRAWQGLPTI